MKKINVNITLEDTINHLKYLNNQQLKELGDAIALKTMSPNEGNRRIAMIRETQEILTIAFNKGMSWTELRQVIESLPNRGVVEQKRFF